MLGCEIFHRNILNSSTPVCNILTTAPLRRHYSIWPYKAEILWRDLLGGSFEFLLKAIPVDKCQLASKMMIFRDF